MQMSDLELYFEFGFDLCDQFVDSIGRQVCTDLHEHFGPQESTHEILRTILNEYAEKWMDKWVESFLAENDFMEFDDEIEEESRKEVLNIFWNAVMEGINNSPELLKNYCIKIMNTIFDNENNFKIVEEEGPN